MRNKELNNIMYQLTTTS